MKSSHRHQLETNVLADWLGKKLDHLEPYKNQIAVGAFAVLGILVLAFFWLNREDVGAAAEWSSFYSAYSLPEPTGALEMLVDKGEPNSPPILWAKKRLADEELKVGAELLFRNKSEAFDKLERADGLYTFVINNSSQPLLKNTARLGLARTYESKKKVDDARTIYEELSKLENDEATSKAAKEGLKRLEDPRELDALAWFAEQKTDIPPGHPPLGGFPGLDGPLPDRPNLSFPSGTLNNDGTTKPTGPTFGPELPPLPNALTPPKNAPPKEEPKETTPPAEGSTKETTEPEKTETPSEQK